MMHDPMGNSYLNEVTPLYYYPPQNGFNYGYPYGYHNLESNGPNVGVSSGSMVNDFTVDAQHAQNAAADTEIYHYKGAEHPSLIYSESGSAEKKKTQEQNQPLLHHLLQ